MPKLITNINQLLGETITRAIWHTEDETVFLALHLQSGRVLVLQSWEDYSWDSGGPGKLRIHEFGDTALDRKIQVALNLMTKKEAQQINREEVKKFAALKLEQERAQREKQLEQARCRVAELEKELQEK